MDYTLFFLFAVFMVGTPGPANMLLMTSGANFGFWRSLPFVVGVTFGKLFINLLLGLGLWQFAFSKSHGVTYPENCLCCLSCVASAANVRLHDERARTQTP